MQKLVDELEGKRKELEGLESECAALLAATDPDNPKAAHTQARMDEVGRPVLLLCGEM